MSLLNCRPHTTIGGTMPKDYPRCQARTRASLGKEGWLRPLRKYREATIAGADGVVVQKKLFWSLNEPPRPLSTERGYFLMARPPLLCRNCQATILFPPQGTGSILLQCARPGRRTGQCWEATRAPTQGPTPKRGIVTGTPCKRIKENFGIGTKR